MDTDGRHPDEKSPIHVDESGRPDGPTVVLIHGSLDRSAGMARLARALSADARIIRYDRRGYGRSWPHRGPFTVDDQVGDLLGIVGDRPVILVGHSYGGHVALAACAALGDQVHGVSTYETPVSWMPWWPTDTAGSLGVSAGPDQAAERFMVRLVGESTWNALPARTKEARRREGVALVGELGSLREGRPWDPGTIRCPVLCGAGSRAREHHHRGTRYLVSELPDARYVRVDDAGHGAPHTHPLEFAEQLVRPHLVSWSGGRR